jgi:hypothetical protein
MYYGMSEGTKAGKWLCKKCHTWNDNRSTKECPFCSTKRPDSNKSETAKGGEPTKVDRDLFMFLKTASLADKTKIMKYIEDEIL